MNQGEKMLRDKFKQLGLRNNVKVMFSEDEILMIKKDIELIIEEKQKEAVHKLDSSREFKRWFTGMLGELAVEKYLGVKFSDRTAGNSINYNIPDMQPCGYNIGIKSCRFPNFPVINRNINTPQIFVFILENPYRAVITGIADVDVLKENLLDRSNDDLVYAKSMLSRKTAFSKIEKLKKIDSLADLDDYRINTRF